ncbi:MAG: response regulator [Acidobacteriota bacterium]
MAKRPTKESTRKTFSDEQRLKLLVVDEDSEDLNYYAGVLRYLGYDVRSMNSYARAAALLGKECFDLVIVDQGSSDFEGRSVLTRAVEVDRHVPVLVLTRTVDADCCIDALDSGAHEYVQKPLTTAEVRELVADYLTSSPGMFSASHVYPIRQNAAGSGDEEAEPDFLRRAS